MTDASGTVLRVWQAGYSAFDALTLMPMVPKVGTAFRNVLTDTSSVFPRMSGSGGSGAGRWELGGVNFGNVASGEYEATFGSATSTNYKGTFFAANPELKGMVVVHHAVEQQVLMRYPGVVSELEMHSLENLRGIPKEINSDVHLSAIRKEWNQFYRSTPNATQQQLLNKATEIDKRYGVQFNPPVRP